MGALKGAEDLADTVAERFVALGDLITLESTTAVAIATMAGSMRALCELTAGEPAEHVRERVLNALRAQGERAAEILRGVN